MIFVPLLFSWKRFIMILLYFNFLNCKRYLTLYVYFDFSKYFVDLFIHGFLEGQQFFAIRLPHITEAKYKGPSVYTYC